MENIGAKLKDKRQDKKLSVEEVSKRTRIQKHVIEALEQGRAEEILGDVYAKSFLKKYALFLGLKLPEGINQDGSAQNNEASLLTLSPKKRKSKNFNWQRFMPLIKNAAIVIIVIILAVFLVKTVRLVHKNILDGAKKKAKVEKKLKIPARAASMASEAKKTTHPPQPPSATAKVTPSRLLLKTKKDVWVQVKSDGHTVFEGFLKRASQEEWAFEKEMHLWLGNAAFVELTLNGKYYGSPGKGVIKDIVITKEGIQIK